MGDVFDRTLGIVPITAFILAAARKPSDVISRATPLRGRREVCIDHVRPFVTSWRLTHVTPAEKYRLERKLIR